MEEHELAKVKLLDTLERALRAYEVGAFPGISSELFKELVTNVQALLEEDAGKDHAIASFQVELEDARNTLNSARKVIDQLDCSVQAQEHPRRHVHHAPQARGTRSRSTSTSTPASSTLSSMPHDGSKEAQSPNSQPCSLSFDASTLTEGSHQYHSDAALYQSLAELQEERQRLKLQVESLQQDLAHHSRHAQEEMASQQNSHVELQAALVKAQQQLEQTRVSTEKEVAQWQKTAEHAAVVAEEAQAQVDQLKAELSSVHALVNAHERDSKRFTSKKLELEEACTLLEKREQRRSEMDARLVCPLLTWYARVGYPQEQHRQQLQEQVDHEPSNATQPPTPAKASGKADPHQLNSASTFQTQPKETARGAAGVKLRSWRGAASGPGPGAMGVQGGLISQRPPEHKPISFPHALKGQQDGWTGNLPEPVPLVPLPPRSHIFKAAASHAGAVLGPIVCEVDSAADRRLEVAVAATQLLMARVSDVDAQKQDVQAQLVAASDRYQRMEAGMLHKHAKEVAELHGQLKAASLACTDLQRQVASLQPELGLLQRDRADAVMEVTRLQSEADALMAKVQQKSLAAEESAKDFAAQLKLLAEEKRSLQRQLIDAKHKVQAANERLFSQETAAAARLQECLVQKSQEQAAALAQEQDKSCARLVEVQEKAVICQREAQLRQDRQASLMQAEYAAKLQAAHTQLRLQDSEGTSQRAQAHLCGKIKGLEVEAAQRKSRLQLVEGELHSHKVLIKDLELKRGSADSTNSSLKSEIAQLQGRLKDHQSQALQQAKEKDDLEAQLQHMRQKVQQVESTAKELEAQKLILSSEHDNVAAALHSKVKEFHQRFASLGDAQQALSSQLHKRSKQDEAEINRLQQDLSRSVADRSSMAAELDLLKGAVQELKAGISAAEQAADHALQARDVAHAVMEQHKGAVEALREQQAQQEAQHQSQLAKLQTEMLEQQREAGAKLAAVLVKQQQLWNVLKKS